MCRVLGVLAVMALSACGDGDATHWLSDVEDLQRQVRRAVDDGDAAEAAELLLPMAEGQGLDGAEPEERRMLRQDAYYQLARLATGQNDAATAKSHADAGLALGGSDVFVANLWVARGQAHEALGEAAEAASDYHRALLINERLLDALLAAEPEN